MAPPAAQYDVVILESHLDVFGHMNNASYLVLFEEARWDLITRNGYGLPRVLEVQQGPVVLELTLKFRREISLRETIRITTELVDYTGKIGRFRQAMIKADGTLATELSLAMGLFDMKARKLIEPTPEWKQAIGFA
jgi:acyl-CoA thioester hydrolase